MEKLTVLAVEYITGGGLNNTDFPSSMATEALKMLQALIDNLQQIPAIEFAVMLDYRMLEKVAVNPGQILTIESGQNFTQEFIKVIAYYDAIWPVAPESENILQSLSEAVERAGKLLLTSPAAAVTVAGDKYQTYLRLREYSIDTVKTYLLSDFNFMPGEWILKPADGVGCEHSHLIASEQEFSGQTAAIDKFRYVIQPHIQGEKTSLSCLFKQGKAWLICVNRQHFEIVNRQYHLTGITVNCTPDYSRYQNLLNKVAQAFPELWGYAGIDLIETQNMIYILEINPRLTTSCAAIFEACGINVAEAVLELLSGMPRIEKTGHKAVYIDLSS